MGEPRQLLKPLLLLLLAVSLLAIWPASVAVTQDRIVSAVPSPNTPAPDDGEVLTFAQVGSWMVAGGDFTSVTPVGGGTSVAQPYLIAFNPTTGALNPAFAPALNGQVKTLEPGPTPGTVYVGGQFTQINGANQSHIALLNVANGQPVAGFKAASTNGLVNALELSNGRLLAGGAFTTAGSVAHGGLASFNPTTGAVTTFMNQQLAERHNNTGTGAQAAVQVRAMDVTPDGSRLVVIGNFRKVDGLDRVQLVMIDLSGASSTVLPDWRTTGYEPLCFSWAFDTYMRGVDFSPDGSYFVVTATGGGINTLCDTAARFETAASGQDIKPTWVDYTGGDTLWSVAITEKAVYVGGHQRWLNNSLASDNNGAGSVPRPGLAALDIQSGLPLAWNPGRNPRGEAAYALYATDTGLWLGQDTQWIGNFKYKRPRMAFFPLAGGYNQPSDAVDQLPGDVYLLGQKAPPSGNVLYRVNAGGSTLGSLDAGPDWSADDGGSNPLRNSGSNAAGWSPGATTDGTVPASTPNAVFDTERWDPSDATEMAWSFPVQAGLPLQVRLYFANRYDGTSTPGTRVYDVTLEGTTVLNDWDIVQATGGTNRGTMRAFNITSDGTVNIGFRHMVENPLINAIEIVRTDQAPPGPAGLDTVNTVHFDGTAAAPAQAQGNGGIQWGNVRGAFLAGGTLFYGWSDGYLYRRPFNGTTFGPATKIDPYNDPAWAGVTTGSGDTFDGALPNFYGQISSVTGMFYDHDRVYYTRAGQSQLFWRWFNVDSGIIGADQFTAPAGTSFSGWNAGFVDGARLYMVNRSNGALGWVPWNNGSPTGSPTVVDSPATGGNDWRAEAMFVSGVPAPPPNNPPTADFSSSCTGLTCSFTDQSTDTDGTIASRSWTFQNNGTSTQTNPSKTFGSAGTYDVTLQVTDNDGATDSVTKSVTVSAGPAVSFVAEASAAVSASSATVTVPASVQTGDRLLLLATTAVTNTPPTPAGWTLLRAQVSGGMASFAWTRAADAATAGSSVVVDSGAATKITAAVVAYRNAQLGSWDSSAPAAGASRTTPTVTGGAGAWVVSYWGDKASNTRAWTAPAGNTTRDVSYTSGSGNVSSLLVDSGGAVPAGSVGGLTATTDLDSTRATTWTFALLPN